MEIIDVIAFVVCVTAAVDWLVYSVRRGRGQEVLCWYCPRCKMAIPANPEGGVVRTQDISSRDDQGADAR